MFFWSKSNILFAKIKFKQTKRACLPHITKKLGKHSYYRNVTYTSILKINHYSLVVVNWLLAFESWVFETTNKQDILFFILSELILCTKTHNLNDGYQLHVTTTRCILCIEVVSFV